MIERPPARPLGPVSDEARIIPDAAEGMLDTRLRNYQTETGVAIVVATVSTLRGRTIEDEAFRLFNSWGIGDARTDRGLLILIAPNERRVRIQVGCGMENAVSNRDAKDVIETAMIPRLATGKYQSAIETGLDALTAKVAQAKEFGALSAKCLQRAKAA